jgi:hypothetical protein
VSGPAMPHLGEVLTAEEACRLLRISWPTLRDDTRIPYLVVGKGTKRPRRRYLRSQLLKLLEEAPA